MVRSKWLAVLAVTLAPLPCLAQFGGGGFPQETQTKWTVRVELVGGQSVEGPLHLDPIAIEGDLGLYAIKPEKIKAIRLSPQGDDPLSAGASAQIHGTVITTTDEEIGGVIYVPTEWTIETDLGTLKLNPAKLRSITITDKPEGKAPTKPGAGGARAPGGGGAGDRDGGPDRPQYMQFGKFIWATSPLGDRVTVYNTETKKTLTLRLPASKEAPLEVMPITNVRLTALHIKGPKITRIAVLTTGDGTWHPQDLREPVEGVASPIVGNATAVYGLGRYIYAFSAEAGRWGVLELPEGSSAAPVVGGDSVTVETDGHIYTFRDKTGEWEHVDIRALLDTAENEGKDD
jgi:hypothetical protein